MMSLSVFAVVPQFSASGGMKISVIQGYFSRIDTCVVELINNRYKFVESQTIPSITISSKEYPGYLNEENTRIYWPIGITADDVLPSDKTIAKNIKITYDFTDVKVIDLTNNSEGTIKSIAPSSAFTKAIKTIILSKYQPINYIYISDPKTEFDVTSPSKLSDPLRGSSKKLYGKYEVRIETGNPNNYLIYSFTPDKNFDSTTSLAQAIVIKEDGTEVDRFEITRESESTFSTFIDRPITDDGNYYIVYDFPGAMQVHDLIKRDGTYPFHMAPIKMGPYTVDSNSAEKFVFGTAVSQPFASTIYTDDLPSEWRVEVKNANSTFQAAGSDLSAVELRCTGASNTIRVKPEIRFENKEVVISLKELNEEILKQSSPAKNYTLTIPGIDKFISGTTDNGETITFYSSTAISTTYNLSVPAPAASLNAYVKHPDDELELGDGE